MEFHQIRYFLAACDHMNFTRAAEASAVSQPALTVAIQKLEEELGGQLFLRDGRGLRLTELGRTMRTHLGRIEATRTAARAAAQAIVGREMETVDVGIMCTIGPRVLAPALGSWQAREKEVELVLHDVWGERAQELLLSGAIDCALIARRAPLPDRFETVPLMTEPVDLGMAEDHPLAAKNRLSLGDLAGVPYIDRLRCEFRQEFFGEMDRRLMGVDVVMRSEREDWMQQAVASGQGVAMLPRHSVVVSGIATRPIRDLKIERVIEAVTVRGRPRLPVVDRFLAHLAETDWLAA